MTTAATTDRTDRSAPLVVRRDRKRISPGRIGAWVLLWLAILVTIAPFWWMLRTALSNNHALAANSFSLLPADFTLGGFKRVFGIATPDEALAEGGSVGSIHFWLYLRNSVIVSTGITVFQVLFSAMAAFAFSRLTWPGRDKMFAVFLTALMVPPIFTSLPNFITVKNLGLLGTLPGIMLPALFMTPFAIFFMRQFFLGISREIDEAAMIDGAKPVGIFFRITLPMSAAPVTTLALLTFIAAWNDYFWPLLVGREENSRVLTVALGMFQSQTPQGSPDWAGLMAASLVAALPIAILFVALGKRVINNIGFSGIK